MPKKDLNRFTDLTWDDLNEWAGGRIVSRGRSYQQQGYVSGLAITEEGGIIAWVDGSERYATKVDMDNDGLPTSNCTCPYEFDCKHAVALVLEYLEQVENNRRVPKASKDDERQALLVENDNWDDDDNNDENTLSGDIKKEINTFLQSKTKNQLINLISDIAEQYPEIAQELVDRKQLTSGETKALVTRLRKEIREIGQDPGWQDYWRGEGYTPDYSGIRNKLETLLNSGYADEVLVLGGELVVVGIRQVEQSHDHGETGMEVYGCLPVIVKALDQSSLASVDKLAWAVDAVRKDQFDICGPLAEYLNQQHPKAAWHALADRLLAQLKAMKPSEEADSFSRNYARDQLSDWAIHALEQSGRTSEIIPLCETEARKTCSYERLVKRLITERRYEDAERWIHEGILSTNKKWPGIASNLRNNIREIHIRQKNWPVVAAIQAEEFIRHPSRTTFTDCKKAAGKVNVWPKVREHLLAYLESSALPWKQKEWPLPETRLDTPEIETRNRYPMFNVLIDIAILEKMPDRVLHWYDQRPQERFGWFGTNEDDIATAVQNHAPDRAVAIWKKKAERLIAQVKPNAYREAAKFLRKAAQVMARQKKQTAWDQYLQELREKHARKKRLIEILDGLDGKSIVKKRR